MNQYISYHKKPYSTFMSVEDYNAKFGTSIEADEEYEMYFKLHYEKARKESGPDEFITVKFYDMAERKSWSMARQLLPIALGWVGDFSRAMLCEVLPRSSSQPAAPRPQGHKQICQGAPDLACNLAHLPTQGRLTPAVP